MPHTNIISMMKKLILSVVAVLSLSVMMSVNANAQSKFNKGDFALNVNYGLGAFSDNDWNGNGGGSVTQHSIGVMGEYGIMNVINERGTISVGGQFGMGFGSENEVDFRRIRIATRGTLHYSFIPQIDTYGGVTFCFVDINKYKWDGYTETKQYYGQTVTVDVEGYSETKNKFIEPRLFAGARYMFNENIGVNLETSWDRFAFVAFGFTFKF